MKISTTKEEHFKLNVTE